MQEKEQVVKSKESSMPDNCHSTTAPEAMLSYPATRLVDNLRENGATYDFKQRRISLERITSRTEKRRQSLPVLPSYLTINPKLTTKSSLRGRRAKKQRKGVTFPLGVLMQQAVTDGDLQAIKQLITSNGSKAVEEREPNGLPPIMRAIFEDQLACLKFLLDAGADVTSRDQEGWNALHVAAAMDDIRAAELVLNAAGNQQDLTTSENVDGEKPIDLTDSLDMARLLLHADLNELRTNRSKSKEGSSVVKDGSSEEEVLQLVKDHCEKHSDCTALDSVLKANTCYDSLLHLAASKNYPHLAHYVCKHQLSPLDMRDSKSGWTPLHTAAYYNSLDTAILLVEQRANVHVLSYSFEKPADLSQHQLIRTLLEDHHAYLASLYI